MPQYILAGFALVLGAVAAYEDFRRGKIRNKWIIAGFAGGLILNAAAIIYLKLSVSGAGINSAYILKILLNSALAFVCGFALWKLSAWSAGDAKLFAMFAFLTPLDFYSRGYIDYFPAFNLLINIFAAAFAVVLLKIVYGALSGAGRTGDRKPAVTAAFFQDFGKNIAERWHMILVMFALFNLLYLAMIPLRAIIRGPQLQALINILFLVFIFVAIAPLSARVDKFFAARPGLRPWTLALIPAALYLVYATRSGHVAAQNAKTIAFFMIFVGIFRKLLESYLKNVDAHTVKVRDLLPGMIPADATREQLKDGGELQTVFMDGFSIGQVNAIQSKLDGDNELEMQRTIPFAPLALCGLILTLALRQSVVHLLLISLK
ncbi:MAG: prepilin peptidase [bacterium]